MQYICDSEGQKISVIVPIAVWQEIVADKETTYLLSSTNIRERLLRAKNRHAGISLEEACTKLGI
jgi:PHD/YefM family antitoxin component YafN of YafNO toxin-antitoxin module